MKKFVVLVLALCLMTALAVPASADVLWEPMGDRFYGEHSEEFSLNQHLCYANSPTGKVTAYDKPGGKALETIDNGESFYVYYVYTAKDGTQWGMNSNYNGRESVNLYIPMSGLLDVYDQEFRTDRAADISETAPEDLEAICEAENLLFWTYPGGIPTEMNNMWKGQNLVSGCHEFYKDEDGNVWGYIIYWYGHQDSWVCLTDPTNADLAKPEIYTAGTRYFGENAAPLVPSAGDSTPGTDSVDTPHTSHLSAEDIDPQFSVNPVSGLNLLAIILPVAAIVIAAALLFFWPKKKK